jgi:hypothetical protein
LYDETNDPRTPPANFLIETHFKMRRYKKEQNGSTMY